MMPPGKANLPWSPTSMILLWWWLGLRASRTANCMGNTGRETPLQNRSPLLRIVFEEAARLEGGQTLVSTRAKAESGLSQNMLISERFAGFERVGDALLGFAFAAEGDEGFALQVKEVLFADELRGGERAAGQDVAEFAGD